MHFVLGATFDTGIDFHVTELRCGPRMGNPWTSTGALTPCAPVRSYSDVSATLWNRPEAGLATLCARSLVCSAEEDPPFPEGSRRARIALARLCRAAERSAQASRIGSSCWLAYALQAATAPLRPLPRAPTARRPMGRTRSRRAPTR